MEQGRIYYKTIDNFSLIIYGTFPQIYMWHNLNAFKLKTLPQSLIIWVNFSPIFIGEFSKIFNPAVEGNFYFELLFIIYCQWPILPKLNWMLVVGFGPLVTLISITICPVRHLKIEDRAILRLQYYPSAFYMDFRPYSPFTLIVNFKWEPICGQVMLSAQCSA